MTDCPAGRLQESQHRLSKRSRALHVLFLVLFGLVGSCAVPSVTGTAEAAPPSRAADVAFEDDVGWLVPIYDDEAPTDVIGLPGEFAPVDTLVIGWSEHAWLYFEILSTVVREASRDATVVVFVTDPEEEALLAYELGAAGANPTALEVVYTPLDSVWIRDYGPLVVRTHDGGRRVIDPPYDRSLDDRVPAVLAERRGWPSSRLPLDLEGGHLQADGTGRCLITDDVLLRNAEHGTLEREVREVLRTYLGCQDVVVLPALEGEETGHLDVFLYVTGPSRVLLGRYRRWQDPINHARLEASAKQLRAAGFEVERVPMPDNDRRRLFRTYTNAVTTNGTVFVPVYQTERRSERAALRAFARHFPDRRVAPVPVDDVIDLGGALHCMTMTVPAP